MFDDSEGERHIRHVLDEAVLLTLLIIPECVLVVAR
jgi:hypothetical protein